MSLASACRIVSRFVPVAEAIARTLIPDSRRLATHLLALLAGQPQPGLPQAGYHLLAP